MSDVVSESASYWDQHNQAPTEDVSYWLAVLPVRRRVNEFLTGDPDKIFMQRFLESFRDQWPMQRALTVGCGLGELERGVVSQNAALHMDGIDVSPASLAEARRLAAADGYSEAITYTEGRALDWLEQERTYDVVFFHGVLHHLEDLEEVLRLAGERVRGGNPGLVYIEEYVGPSRDEWTDGHLEHASAFFERVPIDHRRTPAVWPPIAIEDPTEMIRSSEIPAIARRSLEIVEERPYFGNILLPLVNAMRGSKLCEHEDLLVEAWEEEHRLAAAGAFNEPCYSILVGRGRR